MQTRNRWLTLLILLAGVFLAACGQEPAAATKIEPAKVEEIAGSEFKKVTLTEKAVERIGVQTAEVRDEQALRTRRVGGRIIASPPRAIPQTGNASSEITDPSTVWVQIRLSESDLSSVDRNQAVRVRLIKDDGEDDDEADLSGEPDDEADDVDGEEDDLAEHSLYYMVDNTNQSLKPGQGVLVELPIGAAALQRQIIPYAAVVYGLQGESWVYTNPEPRVYIRQPVVIDYIEGDNVYLSQGLPAGTQVVVVGAAELYGAETGVSK